ncbi:hypothetical protein GY21_05670 [Cryobacterium roopkundense]|uniref:Type VII secretion protein EccE n=1 Tax=Cryobacterium roopkundense TaxID=1001240 RepID=A0A099JM62_9MICO|nr:hypothetical protein [Cryobacterium roopkundense]KGJ79281.1 hypothetical protein GY21_05670 [Cryobacterium roopkundense]MBB5643670.1 hypothetical protein [Cryobacterium roopkundense]
MSDTRAAYLRYLGGESGHRGFFGGTASKTRVMLLGFFIVGGMVGMVLGLGLPALVAAVAGVGITMLATARTHRGTVLERRRKRARWRARKRLGTDEFVPYEVGAWDQLQEAITRGTKDEKRSAEGLALRMRANPDGADGMGWLQYGANVPGIAWHAPVGEQPYLSVAFSVSGQLRGMETAATLTRAANGWGHFLARRAAPSSLISDVQTLTRVLPPDSARQQLWVKTRLETVQPHWTSAQRESFEAQKLSYDEVIRKSSVDSMVQRHYVVVSWPLDQQFTDAAGKFGRSEGGRRDSWRELMATQIRATERGLDEAKMGDVRALTAKQTTALMLHQQNPHLPIDLTRNVDPLRAGIASHDEFSAHIVEGVDSTSVVVNEDGPTSPAVTWWHRTAAIHGENLAVGGRSPLWCLDLLIGRELTFIRSVSFHLHLVPAGQAKSKARADLVRDQAGVLADRQKGRLISDDSTMRMSAAQRRSADLAAGSHHHGVDWIGFVTISAPTRDDLGQASRQLEEVCATGLGIERLDWQDSFQSGASGSTWPIGRGLRPSASTLATRAINRLAGRSEKEAIS